MAIKKKLLVVAGSGATREWGMPSVSDVDNLFKSQTDYLLAENLSKNLYSFLFDEVQNYWNNRKPDTYNKQVNFEDVLYISNLLTSYNPFINSSALPEVSCFNQVQKADSSLLQSFGNFMVDKLLQDVRGRCKNVLPSKLQELKDFFEALSKEFDVSVITTNYDNVFYRASGKLETGFDGDNGKFDPSRLFQRKQWQCILHIHGSVHFDMRITGTNLHEIHWQDDLNQQFQQNSAGRSLRYTNEGITFPTSTIIAGYGKTAQILTHPFRTYYAEMDRIIFESDAALFLGYGFGDNHINEAFSSYRDVRNRKVVVIDWADDRTNTAGSGFATHPSISKAMSIITTDINDLECLGHRHPQTVQNVKQQQEFELSAEQTRPLAIWYGGMAIACANVHKVLNHLL